MEEIVFVASHRKVVGKQVKALRREGLLPAVIYGRSFTPITISMNHHDASRLLPGISSSHLVVVEVEGEKYNALVKDKQHHPVTGSILHVDFQQVSMTERLRADVSIILVGEAPAVKDLDGVLVMGTEQIQVECLPVDLPEHIEIDISDLNEIGDAVHVRDIKLPENVDVLTDLDEMVVLVTAPSIAEFAEEEEAEEELEQEPEVLERGKKEDEEF